MCRFKGIKRLGSRKRSDRDEDKSEDSFVQVDHRHGVYSKGPGEARESKAYLSLIRFKRNNVAESDGERREETGRSKDITAVSSLRNVIRGTEGESIMESQDSRPAWMGKLLALLGAKW